MCRRVHGLAKYAFRTFLDKTTRSSPKIQQKLVRDRSFIMREGGLVGIWEAPFKNRMTPPQLTNFFTWPPLIAVIFLDEPPPPPPRHHLSHMSWYIFLSVGCQLLEDSSFAIRVLQLPLLYFLLLFYASRDSLRRPLKRVGDSRSLLPK